jgi:SET domain-containing protein
MTKNIIKGQEEVGAFFKDRNIVYLKRSRIEWQPLLKKKLHKSDYYITNIEEFRELDKRYGPDIENSTIAPVYIRKINDKIGFGLFAGEDLSEGDFIGEYTGVIRISEEMTETFEDGSYETDFSWDYPDETGDVELEINGRQEGNELRFVNHNQNYNLNVEHTLHKGQWLIFFVAKRDIKADEQLFVSYGDEYWSGGFRELSSIEETGGNP